MMMNITVYKTLDIETEIKDRITTSINSHGWDAKEGVEDFRLAEWVMNHKGAMGDDLSIRELLSEAENKIEGR